MEIEIPKKKWIWKIKVLSWINILKCKKNWWKAWKSPILITKDDMEME